MVATKSIENVECFRVEIRKLKLDEYQALRKTTGWDTIEDDAVKIALERDVFSICVFDNNTIVGIGRVIGDGAIYFYIQDVIVLPEYQRKGVGKIIMDNIESYLYEKVNNNSFIGLMAADGVQGFYRKYGYDVRPKDRPGMYKIIRKNVGDNNANN